MLSPNTPRSFLNATAIAGCAALLFTASAQAKDNLAERLKKFKNNPQELLESIPEKTQLSGPQTLQKFSPSEISSGDFIQAKNSRREVLAGRAGISDNDRPEDLVDAGEKLIRSIEQMQKRKLNSGKVKEQPWSDYYWALYNGQVAYRYADTKFPAKTKDWKLKADFLLGNISNTSSVDELSPAEKYDLLVGDENKTLTRNALWEGEQFYLASNKVEIWMGICHGWAAAAYMLDRPTNAVKLMAADGITMIKFYPADIKALGSLLWAKSAPDSRFIGGRCNAKRVKKDKIGRVKDEACFDTNPGAWHMAVVNQVGVKKRSFVMDATFDYEVWNQPVNAYSYTYFNPQTATPVDTLADAMVEMKDFTDDKFSKYRSEDARYVVGISMAVDYIAETFPSAQSTDGENNDAIKQVVYEYDLELDANKKIIGGEWYENTHPDFLWTPEPRAKARTAADELLDSTGASKKKWNRTKPMPREWSEVAPRASEAGTPLSTVVEALIEISRTTPNL